MRVRRARAAKGGGDFLPLYLQRIVAISCVLRNDAGFRVGSIGAAGDSEAALIQSFFGMIDRHTPQMVSWNGSCFDLPVLHYRGLLAGVSAARYWELGAEDPEFRYNNYIGRYHTRHIDLMDVLVDVSIARECTARRSVEARRLSRQARHGRQPGVAGVLATGRSSRSEAIAKPTSSTRICCSTVSRKCAACWTARSIAAEEALVRDSLQRLPAPHWREYLDAWPSCGRLVSGERFEVEIESLDQEGRGVAHRDGKAVFIEGALPGERVVYERYRQKARYETGRAISIERESAMRVVPRCPHAGLHVGACGGCSMQHIDARAQVALKQRVLEDALWHIGRVRPQMMLRPIEGPAWRYRHRARMAVRYVAKKSGVLVGFHERASSYVADIRQCEVLPKKVSDLLLPLRDLVYSLTLHERLPQIELAVGSVADRRR